MGLLSLLVLLSALVALTGGIPATRNHRWHALWPVPIMALAIGVGLRDLAGLLGFANVGLPPRLLVLGVWAAVVVCLSGAAEIRAGWRDDSGGGAFVAPAVLIAGGLALLARSLGDLRNGGPPEPAAFLAALLVLTTGALLAVERLWPVHRGLVHTAWSIALVLGAVLGSLPPRRERDPFIEARQEIQGLEVAWRQLGLRVERTDSTTFSGTAREVARYRVGVNDVYIYFIGHDTSSTGDVHLLPRFVVPPPTHGIPHLHRAPHILVLCVTSDWRFAAQLEEIVDALGAGRHSDRSSFERVT